MLQLRRNNTMGRLAEIGKQRSALLHGVDIAHRIFRLSGVAIHRHRGIHRAAFLSSATRWIPCRKRSFCGLLEDESFVSWRRRLILPTFSRKHRQRNGWERWRAAILTLGKSPSHGIFPTSSASGEEILNVLRRPCFNAAMKEQYSGRASGDWKAEVCVSSWPGYPHRIFWLSGASIHRERPPPCRYWLRVWESYCIWIFWNRHGYKCFFFGYTVPNIYSVTSMFSYEDHWNTNLVHMLHLLLFLLFCLQLLHLLDSYT